MTNAIISFVKLSEIIFISKCKFYYLPRKFYREGSCPAVVNRNHKLYGHQDTDRSEPDGIQIRNLICKRKILVMTRFDLNQKGSSQDTDRSEPEGF
jgi:hypothetical protein